MLTILPGGLSANQAAGYYAKDNYYSSEQGIENSEWQGKLSVTVGLTGKVNPEHFEKLLNGIDPQTNESLINKKNVSPGHRLKAGDDLTLSAPKSVSLAALEDERVVRAHNRAVSRTMDLVERDFSFYRKGKRRTVEKSGKLLIAKFLHDTSRKVSAAALPDPQLHTHCVVLNLTRDDDNKWMSVYNDGFFAHTRLIGSIYQNELALEVQRLGYKISLNDNGTFDIEGYERDQLEAFSKRSRQISDLGAKSKKEENSLKIRMRLSKGEELDREILREHWKKESKSIGIIHPVPRAAQARKFKRSEREAASKKQLSYENRQFTFIQKAVDHYTERDVGFSSTKIIENVLSNNLGSVHSYDFLKKSVSNHDGTIEYGTNKFGHKQYTTAQAFLTEKLLILNVNKSKGKFSPIATDGEIEKIIHSKDVDAKFTNGQKAAFKIASSNRDQFIGWQGVAGAGKSYALGDLKELASKKGFEVLGLAPDAEAAKALKEGARLDDASTLASFFIGKHKFLKPQIWIVDEAGKMSLRDCNLLVEKALEHKARVVFVGDAANQLSAVEAGNPFKLLLKSGMQHASLKEHRRQKDATLKQSVELISEYRMADAIENLEESIFEIEKSRDRTEACVNAYKLLTSKERERTLILSGTNENRQLLTDKIRDLLKKESVLTEGFQSTGLVDNCWTRSEKSMVHKYKKGDRIEFCKNFSRYGIKKNAKYRVKNLKSRQKTLVLEADDGDVRFIEEKKLEKLNVFLEKPLEVCVGDRLRWTRNEKNFGRINGQEFTVKKISKIGLAVIEYQCGRSEIIDLKKDQFMDHAFVMTSYSSQGKTADNVLLLADETHGRESLYVAISRAKHSVKIFTESVEDLLKNARKSQIKKSVDDLLKKRAGLKDLSIKNYRKSAEIKNTVSLLRRRKFSAAMHLIEPNLAESRNRIKEVVHRYLSLSEKEQKETTVIGSNDEETKKLNLAIRKMLIEEDKIHSEKTIETLVKNNGPEKVGDYLIIDKNDNNNGLKQNVPYRIISVGDKEITLETARGKQKIISRDTGSYSLYSIEMKKIGVGDKVVLNSCKKYRFGKIYDIKPNSLVIVSNMNEKITIRTNRPVDMNYSFAQSAFERKGFDYTSALISCPSNVGSKELEQAISRANKKYKIFTNDMKHLRERFRWYEIQKTQKTNEVQLKDSVLTVD